MQQLRFPVWLIVLLLTIQLHLCVVASVASDSSLLVNHQCHSYNDLREWPQMFSKGTQWVKIDPYYQPASFCSTQLQVPQPADSRGCFVLNHNDPTNGRLTFNTTDDVLSFLGDPQNEWIYTVASPLKLTVALCFKLFEFSPCDGSSAAQDWLSLVDSFYEAAQPLLERYPLEFVMDGSGTPSPEHQCFFGRWPRWNSTWIVDQDPWGAFLSNDPTQAYDQFQVMNTPEAVDSGHYLRVERHYAYGKFLKGSYPFLYWEPSAQLPIHEVLRSYLEGPIHEAGFRFAINIDPVQLRVYAAQNLTTPAWNARVARRGRQPLLTPLDYGHQHVLLLLIASVEQQEQSGTPVLVYQTLSSPSIGVPLEQSTAQLPLPQPPTKANALSSLPVRNTASSEPSLPLGANLILLSGASGEFTLYSQTEQSAPLSVWRSGTLPLVSGTQRSTANCTATLFEWPLALQLELSNESSALQLAVYNLSNSEGGNATLIHSASVPLPANVVGELGVASVACACEPAFISGGEGSSSTRICRGMLSFDVGRHNQIYASTFQVHHNLTSESVRIGGVREPVVLHVGRNPSVACAGDRSSSNVTCLLTHDHGYCWNSLLRNKDAKRGVCDQHPLATEHILQYHQGDWRGFDQIITSSQSCSPCSLVVQSGVFDQGTLPMATLLDASTAAVAHQGVDNLRVGGSICGYPIPHDGIVVDGWQIEPYLYQMA